MATATALLKRPDPRISLPDPVAPPAQRLTPEAPALPLMTDLRAGPTVTVEPRVQIDAALELMRAAGVRLAFVVDSSRRLLGAVTAQEIQGDRPMRLLQGGGGDRSTGSRSELTVAQLMHPPSQWQVIEYRDAARASIGTIVDAMKAIGQRHLIVVETDKARRQTLRGLFSATRIENELGEALDIPPIAVRYADIGRAVLYPELT
ncbi:MAG TPA: CBS domain-containing protein [Burkholderiaceae bacterium]|nr:CBS domain-containing protein [Burkholderiaceae bacterium]